MSNILCVFTGMTLEDVRRYESKLQDETNKRVLDGVDLSKEEANAATVS